MKEKLSETLFWLLYALGHIRRIWFNTHVESFSGPWSRDKLHCCELTESGMKIDAEWMQQHWDEQFEKPWEFCPWCGMNLWCDSIES